MWCFHDSRKGDLFVLSWLRVHLCCLDSDSSDWWIVGWGWFRSLMLGEELRYSVTIVVWIVFMLAWMVSGVGWSVVGGFVV